MKYFSLKILKIFLAISISILLTYISFREVELSKIYRLVLGAEYLYVMATLITILIAQILRSIRLGVMLHPIQPLSQKILFPISAIGFMLIVLLPARIGELARPYLLYQNSKINMSTAMATIVLERILDTIFLLIFFGIIVINLELPSWVLQGAVFILIAITVLIVSLFLAKLRWINKYFKLFMHKVLPETIAFYVENAMKGFYDGMAITRNRLQTLTIIYLTACIWGVFVLSNLLLFRAFHLQLGSLAALTTLTLTAIGIAVPAAPGFIGNFHFFCMLGLTMFGINKNIALSYAIVNHALIVLTFTSLGIICINILGINVSKFPKIFTQFRAETLQTGTSASSHICRKNTEPSCSI
ncbi:MAG: lysylphosphatidylglycerol synthase transmembrane domain-containing protein [Candidatus Hodarchaeota archaeon]